MPMLVTNSRGHQDRTRKRVLSDVEKVTENDPSDMKNGFPQSLPVSEAVPERTGWLEVRALKAKERGR